MHVPRFAFAAFVLLDPASIALAQCATTWTPTPLTKPDGAVLDQVWWDPDGAGPAGPSLVFAGAFLRLGTVDEDGFAAWDPASNVYFPVATGIVRNNPDDAPGRALAVLPNGHLVIGGAFDEIAGQTIRNLAGFDGNSWYAFGAGTPLQVHALAVLQNGDLVAAGAQISGGVGVAYIQRWDGSAWHSIGTPNGPIERLTVAPNGDLIAAGRFGGINGILVNRIARWNGSSWSPLGTGFGPPPTPLYAPSMRDLDVLANGDVLVCGSFALAGGTNAQGSARWNGSAWSSVDTGVVGNVQWFDNFFVAADGTLHGVTRQGEVHAWNGTAWSMVTGPLLDTWSQLTALPDGELLVAPFQVTPTVQRRMPAGTNGPVLATARRANGEVIVAGGFGMIDGVAANSIARDDGSGWQALGSGVEYVSVAGSPGPGEIRTVLPQPNGELIVGGYFERAGGLATKSMARWHGSNWASMDNGLFVLSSALPVVEALAQLPDGTIVAGGGFTASDGASGLGAGIARWDGTSWMAIGGGLDGWIQCLAVMPNGDLVAGGNFVHASSGATNIARWDGTNWTAMGNSPWTGQERVAGLLALTDGTLVASSLNYGPVHIAAWDGNTWTTIGTASANNLCWVSALHELPDGDLLVGGLMQQIDGVPIQGLARWHDGQWFDMHAAVDRGWERVQSILAIDERLLVTGDFRAIGGSGCAYHAWLDTTCPASTQSIGTSCAAPAALVADLPWLGSQWRARGEGLPTPTFVLAAHGTNAISLPLANVFAQAAPGCVLAVLPDTIELAWSTDGTVTFAHALPDAPALIGATFRSQLVPFELDAAGALLTVTATNAVEMTFGAF